MKTYDAIVIGGGPAGATAAILLARSGWSVALIEKEAFPRRKVCGEFISAGTWPLLRALGVADALILRTGPSVREVGVYAGESIITAPMPAYDRAGEPYGCAVAREHLDSRLLQQARAAGAEVWQPWTARSIERQERAFACELAAHAVGEAVVCGRCVIAAHGSWLCGPLPTQPPRHSPGASDLLAFKAHLENCDLPCGIMPLLVFPGGYGGMVGTSDRRTALSCCIRRDELRECRRASPHLRAGDAVLRHIVRHCRGVRLAAADAQLEHRWQAAGPIHPGMRACSAAGVYVVGNAAGEAHPIVAEGISMAIQSAWLLCERLLADRDVLVSRDAAHRAARDYERTWRRQFRLRVMAAAFYARVAMSAPGAAAARALLEWAPGLLTTGARWSGKVNAVVGAPDRAI